MASRQNFSPRYFAELSVDGCGLDRRICQMPYGMRYLCFQRIQWIACVCVYTVHIDYTSTSDWSWSWIEFTLVIEWMLESTAEFIGFHVERQTARNNIPENKFHQIFSFFPPIQIEFNGIWCTRLHASDFEFEIFIQTNKTTIFCLVFSCQLKWGIVNCMSFLFWQKQELKFIDNFLSLSLSFSNHIAIVFIITMAFTLHRFVIFEEKSNWQSAKSLKENIDDDDNDAYRWDAGRSGLEIGEEARSSRGEWVIVIV